MQRYRLTNDGEMVESSSTPEGRGWYWCGDVDPELTRLRERIAILEAQLCEVRKHRDHEHRENKRLTDENAGLKFQNEGLWANHQAAQTLIPKLETENAELREAIRWQDENMDNTGGFKPPAHIASLIAEALK